MKKYSTSSSSSDGQSYHFNNRRPPISTTSPTNQNPYITHQNTIRSTPQNVIPKRQTAAPHNATKINFGYDSDDEDEDEDMNFNGRNTLPTPVLNRQQVNTTMKPNAKVMTTDRSKTVLNNFTDAESESDEESRHIVTAFGNNPYFAPQKAAPIVAKKPPEFKLTNDLIQNEENLFEAIHPFKDEVSNSNNFLTTPTIFDSMNEDSQETEKEKIREPNQVSGQINPNFKGRELENNTRIETPKLQTPGNWEDQANPYKVKYQELEKKYTNDINNLKKMVEEERIKNQQLDNKVKSQSAEIERLMNAVNSQNNGGNSDELVNKFKKLYREEETKRTVIEKKYKDISDRHEALKSRYDELSMQDDALPPSREKPDDSRELSNLRERINKLEYQVKEKTNELKDKVDRVKQLEAELKDKDNYVKDLENPNSKINKLKRAKKQEAMEEMGERPDSPYEQENIQLTAQLIEVTEERNDLRDRVAQLESALDTGR